MDFKAQLDKDFKEVFYNTSEFAVTAQYKGVDIALDPLDEIEVEHISGKSFSCMSSDVQGIVTGEILTMYAKSFEVVNFDHLDNGLETILVLVEK